MGFNFRRRQVQQVWWSAFSLLIAGPSIALAVLGVRAIRADCIEREAQLAEQQNQVARLADAAIANVLERIGGQLDRMEVNSSTARLEPSAGAFEPPVFTVDEQEVISFPQRKVYFGEIDRQPKFVQSFYSISSGLSEQARRAQMLEAQQRKTEAITLFRLFVGESS